MYTLILPICAVVAYYLYTYGYIIYYGMVGLLIYTKERLRKVTTVIPPITLYRHHNHIRVVYTDNYGEKRYIFVPLDLTMELEASQCEVIAHIDKTGAIPLKQEDDIPILVTANHLNAKYISVRNTHTQEEKLFKGNEKVEYFI